MDQIEGIDKDRAGDRFGERDGETRRVSDGETDKEVSAMLQGYDLGLSDRDDERSPPKLELISEYKTPYHPPPSHNHPLSLAHTMDISIVRFQPVPLMTQAEMTSTYGHPRRNLPELGKVNNVI